MTRADQFLSDSPGGDALLDLIVAKKFRLTTLLNQSEGSRTYLARNEKAEAGFDRVLFTFLAPVTGYKVSEQISLYAGLDHSSLLRIREWGTVAEGWLEGCSFAAWDWPEPALCTHSNLELPEVIHLLSDAAQAIEYLGKQRFTHGDIRPENLHLCDGEWKLGPPQFHKTAPTNSEDDAEAFMRLARSLLQNCDRQGLGDESLELQLNHFTAADIARLRKNLPLLRARHHQTLIEAANQGDGAAQIRLACGYRRGAWGYRLYSESINALRRAAETGIAEAQHELGQMDENQSDAQAVGWYRLAAKSGWVAAQYDLARLLESHPQLAEDGEDARALYEIAAENGHPEAQFQLGCLLAQSANPQELVRSLLILQELADKNHRQAWDKLSELYEKGHGQPRGSAETTRLLRRAVARGDASAQYALAESMIVEGRVPTEDASQYADMMRAAAENGHADAQYAMGIYLRDAGDPDCGRFFTRAADQGHPLAICDHAQSLQKSAKPDFKKIFALYEQASASGVAAAHFWVGCCCLRGEGTELDLPRAVSEFHKAADKSYTDALQWLGYVYELGLGVERDYSKAIHFYQRAADLGQTHSKKRVRQLIAQHETSPSAPGPEMRSEEQQ